MSRRYDVVVVGGGHNALRGSGPHPGGGAMAARGRLAARKILAGGR